jgi:hypothetical protein
MNIPSLQPVHGTRRFDTFPVFVDAPIVLLPADMAATFGTAQSLDALGADEASPEATDPALQPRAWWKANPERTMSVGIEQSVDMLTDLCRKEKFDVRLCYWFSG